LFSFFSLLFAISIIFVNIMSQAGNDLAKYLQSKKEDVHVRIIRFPEEINRAPALGYLEIKTENGEEKRIFVKNRDDDETYRQVACSHFGAYFSKAIGLQYLVAPAQGIPRPKLVDLEKDSAGETIWILMEDTWKKVLEERKCGADDDSSGTDCTAYAFAPSEYDFWHLEEAVLYAPDLGDTDEEPDSTISDVDASLRRKLRKAASGNPMKCLDVCKLLFLPEYTQKLVKEDEDWKEYQEHDYGLLKDAADALTKEETRLLLHNKLASTGMQASFLFVTIVGFQDLTSNNMAVRENEDESGGWTLDPGLFDCDVLSAKLGVSLKDAVMVAGGWQWEEDNGYDYPFLFSLPVADMPLDETLSKTLLDLDLDELEKEAFAAFKTAEGEDLAPVFRERAKLLQDAVRDGPADQTIRQICYKTMFGWERDWEANQASDGHKWIQSTLDWASNTNTEE
jgi:hypothetical protein